MVILIANWAAFAATCAADGGNLAAISARALFSAGAITETTLSSRQYWRLVACMFLHGGRARPAYAP